MRNTLGRRFSVHKQLGAVMVLILTAMLMVAPAALARPDAGSADRGACALDPQILKNEPGLCSYTGSSVASFEGSESTSAPTKTSDRSVIWLIAALATAALLIGAASASVLHRRPHAAA